MAKKYSDEEILAYKTKAATPVQERYADWLKEKLQLEFASPKAEAAFDEAVRISTALRMIFQASDENQEARAEARSEREEAAAAKPKGKPGKKAKPAAEDEDEPEAKPAKAAKPAKKAAAAKAKPADNEDEADEAVAVPTKKTGPKKASARSGAAAPF